MKTVFLSVSDSNSWYADSEFRIRVRAQIVALAARLRVQVELLSYDGLTMLFCEPEDQEIVFRSLAIAPTMLSEVL